MRFADPQACPDCRAQITGPRCPQCGLDLQDPEVRELWQTLLKADQLLAGAVARRDATVSPPAPPIQPPPIQQPPIQQPPIQQPPIQQQPVFPAPPPPIAGGAPKERSWSVGTVLLALGAIGLVTAAIIFVSRSWSSIGLVGKALVLAAATAAVIAAAGWVTRRPLRASAEALWAVAFALLALDIGGARSEGLFNLDAASAAWVTAISGVALALAGAAVVRWARPHVSVDLISPAIAAVLAVGAAGAGAAGIGANGDGGYGDGAGGRIFWHLFAGLLVVGVLGLVLRFSGSGLIAIGSRVVVGGFYVASAGFAFAEAVEHPSLTELVGDLHGAPLLVVSLVALAAAWTIPVLRAVMTVVAVTGAGLLVVIPAAEAGDADGGWLAVAGLALVLSVAGMRGAGGWSSGLRWGAVLPAAGLLGLLGWWVSAVLEACSRALDDVDGLAAADRVQTTARELGVIASIVCAVAIVIVTWVVSHWPGLPALADARRPGLAAVTAISIVGVVLSARSPWWLLAAVLVLLAASAVVLARRPGTRRPGTRRPGTGEPDSRWLYVLAGAAALAALATSTATPWVMAVTWVVLGLGALAVALLDGASPERQIGAVVATALVATGVGRGIDAAGGPWSAVVLVALALASIGLFSSVRAPAVVRRPLELGSGVAVLFTACSADSVALAAICWAVVGTVLAAIAMVAGDRRWYVWPSIAAFVASYVLLVIDTGFAFVEAYTLPPAAAALAGGVMLLRSRPQTSSWAALGPGLALAMLPSLPQALADPTGLRALLLGLGAVGVLAVGLWLGRQAPFLLGAVVALLVVLFNIGPYANAAPRVVVISIVSVVLVGLGITWEDRVRDGRRVLAFVRQMR